MTTTNHINHMKNKALFLFLITAGILAVGCEKKRTTSEQLDRVQTKTAEVAQDMRDFTFAEKDEFVAKMRAELAELNRNLDELSAKVEKSSTAVKSDAQARIAGLREHTARLNKQLDEATDATADRVAVNAAMIVNEATHSVAGRVSVISDMAGGLVGA